MYKNIMNQNFLQDKIIKQNPPLNSKQQLEINSINHNIQQNSSGTPAYQKSRKVLLVSKKTSLNNIIQPEKEQQSPLQNETLSRTQKNVQKYNVKFCPTDLAKLDFKKKNPVYDQENQQQKIIQNITNQQIQQAKEQKNVKKDKIPIISYKNISDKLKKQGSLQIQKDSPKYNQNNPLNTSIINHLNEIQRNINCDLQQSKTVFQNENNLNYNIESQFQITKQKEKELYYLKKLHSKQHSHSYDNKQQSTYYGQTKINEKKRNPSFHQLSLKDIQLNGKDSKYYDSIDTTSKNPNIINSNHSNNDKQSQIIQKIFDSKIKVRNNNNLRNSYYANSSSNDISSNNSLNKTQSQDFSRKKESLPNFMENNKIAKKSQYYFKRKQSLQYNNNNQQNQSSESNQIFYDSQFQQNPSQELKRQSLIKNVQIPSKDHTFPLNNSQFTNYKTSLQQQNLYIKNIKFRHNNQKKFQSQSYQNIENQEQLFQQLSSHRQQNENLNDNNNNPNSGSKEDSDMTLQLYKQNEQYQQIEMQQQVQQQVQAQQQQQQPFQKPIYNNNKFLRQCNIKYLKNMLKVGGVQKQLQEKENNVKQSSRYVKLSRFNSNKVNSSEFQDSSQRSGLDNINNNLGSFDSQNIQDGDLDQENDLGSYDEQQLLFRSYS